MYETQLLFYLLQPVASGLDPDAGDDVLTVAAAVREHNDHPGKLINLYFEH